MRSLLSLARRGRWCGHHLFLAVSSSAFISSLVLMSSSSEMTEEVTQEVSAGQGGGPGEHRLQTRLLGEGEGRPQGEEEPDVCVRCHDGSCPGVTGRTHDTLSRWFVNIHCVETVPAQAGLGLGLGKAGRCYLGEGWPATEEPPVTTYCSLTNIRGVTRHSAVPSLSALSLTGLCSCSVRSPSLSLRAFIHPKHRILVNNTWFISSINFLDYQYTSYTECHLTNSGKEREYSEFVLQFLSGKTVKRTHNPRFRFKETILSLMRIIRSWCKVTVTISICQFRPVYEAVKLGLDTFYGSWQVCREVRSPAEARSSFAEEGRSPQPSHGKSSETLLGGHQVFMTENVFKLRKSCIE